MAENVFKLHEIVQELASKLVLEDDGHMVMTDGELARNRARLIKVTAAAEKKAVLVSLVALASRLMRESREGAAQVIERLLELAAGLIGDGDKARAIFAEAGAVHGLERVKSKSKGSKRPKGKK